VYADIGYVIYNASSRMHKEFHRRIYATNLATLPTSQKEKEEAICASGCIRKTPLSNMATAHCEQLE